MVYYAHYQRPYLEQVRGREAQALIAGPVYNSMHDESHAPTRALIVFNPAAGQAANLERDLRAACEVWRAEGWQVEMRPTTGPGDGTRLAREAAAQGYDVVVAAGGDGTVNEVINGLARTRTALAALPIGTVNVWIRELGYPLQPRAAAEALLKAQPYQIDLGRAGDRYFLLMAGIGFDAAVTEMVRSEEKRRLGVLAYARHALALAWRFQGVRTRVTLDGRPIRSRTLMVVAGNSQLYGGILKLTVRANLNDGLLDVCIIKGKSFLRSAPMRLLSILTGRYNLDPDIEYQRARRIRIEARKPLPVQVDGDPIGYTPIEIEVVPGALRALLPRGLPSDLLREELAIRPRGWRRVLSWLGRSRAGVRSSGTAVGRAAAEVRRQ